MEHRNRTFLFLTLLLSIIGLASDVLSLLTADYREFVSSTHQFAKIFQTSLHSSTFVGTSAKDPELTPLILVFFIYMITITVFELREGIIPDAVTVPGMAIGVGLSLIAERPILSSLLGILVGLGIPAGIIRIQESLGQEPGIGLGVVKMLGMIGAFLGPANVLACLGIAALLGSLYALLFRRHLGFKGTLEFGPALALAAVVCTLFPVTDWYMDMIRQK